MLETFSNVKSTESRKKPHIYFEAFNGQKCPTQNYWIVKQAVPDLAGLEATV